MHTGSPSTTGAGRSYDELLADNAALRDRTAVQDHDLRELRRQLDWLKRQVFGPTCERRRVDGDGAVVDLFAREQVPVPEAPRKEQITYERDKPGSGGPR
jgi:hypothetical protein